MADTKIKSIFNWSGGKDSALALHKVLQENQYEVVSLVTTLDENTGLSFLHSIPINKLQEQAESIGIPLYLISFSAEGKNYEEKYQDAILHFKKLGVTHFIFGDIHLSEIKSYREKKLAPYSIEVLEPLWNKNSEEVINDFFESGIKTKLIVTQADKLGEEYIGKTLTKPLVNNFPKGTDPCGEFGEYHTFAYAGGPFRFSIDYPIKEIVKKTYPINLENGETAYTEFWQAII